MRTIRPAGQFIFDHFPYVHVPSGRYTGAVETCFTARTGRLLRRNGVAGEDLVPNGRVKWFSDEKGFGFIEQEDGQDVFCHHTAIEMEGFRSIAEGQEVEFEVEQSDRGLRAKNVRLI